MKNIVHILKKQHDEIKRIVADIAVEIQKTQPSCDLVMGFLNALEKLLNGHLIFKQKEFYPKLLSEIEKAGGDLEKTKKFIEQMDEEVEKVFALLMQCKEAHKTNPDMEKFRRLFGEAIETLNFWMEEEEKGLCLYLSDFFRQKH